MNEKEFARRSVNGVPYYSCLMLEELSDLRHGFSTRHGGASALPGSALNLGLVAWDSPARVEENRRRYVDALRLGAAHLFTLRQVHSDRIHIIGEIPGLWNRPQGDALITGRPGAALGVQTADCFPILLADPRSRTVAAVHSGWKGTLARLLLKTVRAMQATFGCEPSGLLAAIGPAIRACCYEVGADVADLFRAQYPGFPLALESALRPGKYLLDLHAALQVQLEEAGVPAGNIKDLGACTRCRNDEFFSYRGEGHRAGRLMAVIAAIAS